MNFVDLSGGTNARVDRLSDVEAHLGGQYGFSESSE